ncbi:MAG: hypothetical protein CME06_07245 [Gemmatimonadetes bacterium]|nr:hypothetical protein [Gemmatimonadota bacterium]
MISGPLFLSVLMAINVPASGQPYRDLSLSDTRFLGPSDSDVAPDGHETIRIGVLGPARSAAGDRLQAAVEIAIEEANRRGGCKGRPYEMVFRSDDGLWGTGAKQLAALALEDSVSAIVGGLNGGDAHVAELATAKLWVPLITPTASDMTIDYANVPWVFRIFPRDDLQARSLIDYGGERGLRRLLVLIEGNREGRTGRRRLEQAADRAGFGLWGIEEYEAHEMYETKSAAVRDADALLIWGEPTGALELIRSARADSFDGPVLLAANTLGPELISARESLGELIVAAPYDLGRRWPTELERAFRSRTGSPPDPVGIFTYDATRMIIEAIDSAGPSRTAIRSALAEGVHSGLAGTYRFDGLGGASMAPVLCTHRKGRWSRIPTSKVR